nr:hypothetical protein [Tanacetum cinerariifolium]
KDFSKSTSVTQTHVSNDFSKPVTAQNFPSNMKSILKNTNVLAPGMYTLHTDHTRTRTSQLQLKSNPQGDRVMHNNSQGKKKEVEDHRMSVKLSKNKTTITAFASESNNKPRNFTRKLYERVSKTCSWWYPKFTPSGYICKPKSGKENVNPSVSMPLGKASRTAKLIEIVLFIVDSGCSKHMTRNLELLINFVEKFLGTRVYYVEGLNHNLFSVGQFCDADLEVAFRKSTYFIRDLKGNDLLTGSRGTDLYSITLQDTNSPNPIFLMAKATSSQAWLVQRGLQAQVRMVRTDKGSEFLNQTLYAYFIAEGIQHQTSVARTPEQNGVVERRNRTLVETDRTMLSAAKVTQFFWAEAIATACFTQNRSLVIPRHEKTPYHIINDRKPSVNLIPAIQRQANVSQADRIVKMSNELDLLFSLMFDELLNGSSKVVSKSSAVSAADAPNQRKQYTTPLNNLTTPASTCQIPSISPTVISSENINQAETHAENDQTYGN